MLFLVANTKNMQSLKPKHIRSLETGLIIRDDSSNIMADMNRIWFEKGLARVPFFTLEQQQPFRSFYEIPRNRSFLLGP